MAVHNEFKMPYIGMDNYRDMDLLYGLNGEFSVVLSMVNPVLQYAGSAAAYQEFHALFSNILKILGAGYLLQKQDVICKSVYPYTPAPEYLQDRYNRHFAGRQALEVKTYLIITRQVKKGAFYSYDEQLLVTFSQQVIKVMAVLETAGCLPELLSGPGVSLLIRQVLALDFTSDSFSLNNISPTATQLNFGALSLKSISLVDIDRIDLPAQLPVNSVLRDNDTLRGFPVDLLSFLLRVPDFHCIVFNQLIEIPQQNVVLRKLGLKRKRHSGIPDPANTLCVQDIDALLNDVARDNQLLVNAHFNVMIAAAPDRLQHACNFLETELFALGIVPGGNSYNQLELFRTAMPGNGIELKPYDWFLTTSDAAICFLFKERLPVNDPSDFLIRFTDRQGIPLGIDLSDLPMTTGRMSNRSRFVLGGSGTGKSFFMASLLEQYMLYNMDVVIIDTGHSYAGLCAYYNGRYITYSEAAPVTMNPFAISVEEYNIEKKEFLITLVTLLWKGADGLASQMESDMITQLISGYYAVHFGFRETSVYELSFNTFYEYALERIPVIMHEEKIPFNFEEFRYVLKKFYRAGEYDRLLNQQVDQSLFEAPFIVFEIDNIKESKVLFPIVTLIIMDVFLQKMRRRSDRRKCLVCEEAWKAIASPLMANYLLYLYKTVRKFWGEAIVVTQELADIIGNPIVKDSIIANSGTICLLDQSSYKENYEEIARLLALTDTEKRKIFTVNQLDNRSGRGRFKEVYIRRGMTGEVYGVEVSLQQYLCYTTEKPEKNAVELYVAHYGSYPAGLDAFVTDLNASGLDLGKFVKRVNSAAFSFS